ncbi:MAG: hypothetical protein IKH31_06210 [Clostridia bacterium]|nr:hypothetical protein [Clostridia bacterium]
MNDSDKLKALGEISPEYIDSAAGLKKRRPLRAVAVAAAAMAAAVGTFFAVRAMLPKAPADDKTAHTDATPLTTETAKPAAKPTPTPEPTDEPEPTMDPNDPLAWIVNYDPNATHAPETDRQKRLRDGAEAAAELPAVPYTILSEGYNKYYIALRQKYANSDTDLADFYKRTAAEFLLAGERNENAAYSPLNVYMALAMMAETAGGETRNEVLDLLGADSIEELRENAGKLFLMNYYDNDLMVSIPAASLWVNSRFGPALKKEALGRLSGDHHASVYKGDMASPEFTELFRDWMNENTGGLLEDQINEMELSPEELMRIVSTLYYKVFWRNKFYDTSNTEELFHSPTGDERVTFMHGGADSYFEAEGFTAARKDLQEGAGVWFILPDEGTSLDELISSGKAMELVLEGGDEYYVPGAIIHFNMPKFDIETKLDLKKSLMKMGVTDCFTADGDFTPLTDMKGVYVSSVDHGVRVIADEEGVSAAAYVMLPYAGATPPQREVEFTLDRPFMFVITGADGTPLFMGTVYHPAG